MNQAGDCPQVSQSTDPSDTEGLQPGAADGWTTMVLVEFAHGWGSSGTSWLLAPTRSGLQSTTSAPTARGCLVLIFRGIILSLWNEVLCKESSHFLCLCWR